MRRSSVEMRRGEVRKGWEGVGLKKRRYKKKSADLVGKMKKISLSMREQGLSEG